MARLKDTVIPLGDYPTGVHEYGPLTIANDVGKIGIDIARCTSADPTIWPNVATTIAVRSEISYDNGQTWQGAGAFTAQGGIHVRGDGSELQSTYFMVRIQPGHNRRFRGTITIDNGPLRTLGSLVTSP